MSPNICRPFFLILCKNSARQAQTNRCTNCAHRNHKLSNGVARVKTLFIPFMQQNSKQQPKRKKIYLN